MTFIYKKYQSANIHAFVNPKDILNIVTALDIEGVLDFIPITREEHLKHANHTIYSEYYGACYNVINFHGNFHAVYKTEMLFLKANKNKVSYDLYQKIAAQVKEKILLYLMTTAPSNDIAIISNNPKLCVHLSPLTSEINDLIETWHKLLINIAYSNYRKRIKQHYYYKTHIQKINKSFIFLLNKIFKQVHTLSHTKREKNLLILQCYSILNPLLKKYKDIIVLLYSKLYMAYIYYPGKMKPFANQMAFIKSYFHEACLNNDDYTRNEFLRNFRNIAKYYHYEEQPFLLFFITNLKLYRILYKHGYRIYIDYNFEIIDDDPENSLAKLNIYFSRELRKEAAKFYHFSSFTNKHDT